MTTSIDKLPHVVIVGGGFGGIAAAKELAKAPVKITLIDKTNHHLFQPLLYQVATAGLSPAEIAAPIRSILSKQQNVTVQLDEVVGVDLPNKTIKLKHGNMSYDFLILAVGMQNNYFGHDDWAPHAPGLKDLRDALEIRERVLLAFESAERERNEERRKALLTFVVIGGGATGVELAGAIAELAKFVIDKDFRVIDPESARVVLVEGGPRILSAYDHELSEKAVLQLKELGVEVRQGKSVVKIDAKGVLLAGDEMIRSATVIWGAGVRAANLTKSLGVPLDKAGRIMINQDTSIPDYPEAFVVGDAAGLLDEKGNQLPGVSQNAMQQAVVAAKNIKYTLRKKPRITYKYFDKGSMATIGRSRAIAQLRGGMKLSGFIAWLAWLVVHLWYLIEFRNRFIVLFNWFWSYVTYKRGARLITAHRLDAGSPVSEAVKSLPEPTTTTTVTPVEKAPVPVSKSA